VNQVAKMKIFDIIEKWNLTEDYQNVAKYKKKEQST